MPKSANPVPLAFPKKGVNENQPYAAPPGEEFVRPDHVLNMRLYDSLERRKRGGQRTGISKYFADAINGSEAIQRITSFTEAFDPNSVVADEQIFTEDFTALSTGRLTTNSTNWQDGMGSAGTSGVLYPYLLAVPATTYFPNLETHDGGTVLVNSGGGTSSANNDVGARPEPALTIGSNYVIRATVKVGRTTLIGGFACAGIILRADWDASASPEEYYSIYLLHDGAVTGQYTAQIKRNSGGAGGTVIATSSSFVPAGSGSYTDTLTIEVRVAGDNVSVLVDGDQKIAPTDIGNNYVSNTHIGLACNGRGTVGGVYTELWQSYTVFRGTQPASLRTSKIVAIAGGTVQVGTPADGMSTPTGGSAALKTSGRVDAVEAFQDVFFVDGFSANYQYYDAATTTVKDWATDVTAGTLPQGSVDTTLGCRICVVYRGRVFMAGLSEDPQNWFASRSGDPFDWDYSPSTTDAQQAIAGNNAPSGKLGQVITALAPFQDDVMIMSGSTSLWIMQGDPAAGGAIDNISRLVGIVQQTAWAWSTKGVLYFFGNNGLYRLAPGGGPPDLVSEGRLDKTFANVDTANNVIQLAYDPEWQGVHIFITPQNEPASAFKHYYWDERSDGFWVDQYPTNIGPIAIHQFDADAPADRAILMGGYDSFIRKFDATVMNDDGTAIDSYMRLPLLHPNLPMGQFQLEEMQLHTDQNGSAVTLEIYRGKTPQEAALSSTVVFTKSQAAGRNLPVRYRVRGNALQVRLRNNTAGQTWAYENGTAMITGVGRQRSSL